jgi:hypothetical protein
MAYAAECDLLKPYSANFSSVAKISSAFFLSMLLVALGALDEDRALLLHLLADLLAHRAAEHVGAAEGVAGDHAGGLHHLLLVDQDAVGLLWPPSRAAGGRI